ncbi:MAG TPA: energy transducer TonB [Candidatus Cybelea sp.]|nr:energy transducer TonB [Candidatus Cybelea sp.]
MKVRFRFAAPAAAALLALVPFPATAQYSNEFTPAKLLSQGKTTHDIAGNGTVVVQVQVNADGSHKAIKVLRSTNSGDNAAAMDIAQSSSYRPAHRGTTPVVSFYDFTLRFKGKAVVNAPSEGSGGVPSGGAVSPAAGQVAALIRQHQYSAAVSKAQGELMNSPGDDSLRQMLGIAEFDNGNVTAAAAAFDKVQNVGSQFRPIAAASFARAAVSVATSNPTQALAYANKAMAIQPSANSRFALGVAQLANNQNAEALASLKAAHDAELNDRSLATSSKVNLDQELMRAYIATGDTAGAQSIAEEIKRLDPNSNAGTQAMGDSLLRSGVTAFNNKDYATALDDFDKAAASGSPDVAFQANVLAAKAIGNSAKPDYKRMQAYAEKALAIKPNDANANFALGIALTGQWFGDHNDNTKKTASATLSKADQEAKDQGDEGLALQIESFMKKYLNGSPSGQAGGGS